MCYYTFTYMMYGRVYTYYIYYILCSISLHAYICIYIFTCVHNIYMYMFKPYEFADICLYLTSKMVTP